MADRNHALARAIRDEDGTTLSELLIAMTILVVVGTIATTGIVSGFKVQVAAANVATTLDGTRIATQRVRDFVRGADEVCASSTDSSLVLWTDDDDNGVVDDGELDIFELITDASGQDLFQRRTPTAGGPITQLIRDDIINDALFAYDIDPAAQPSELDCMYGGSVTNGPSRTRTVGVTFTVDHPTPGEPDLTTQTTVQIRNAGLTELGGVAPSPAFTFSCPAGTRTCSFDASTTADADGDAIVDYAWNFGGDGTTSGASSTTNHTFSVGDIDYLVELIVTDSTGKTGRLEKTVRPGKLVGNAKPVAKFTVSCFGTSCTFDGSTSTDDTGIAKWVWDFGDGSAPVTQTTPTITKNYAVSGSYVPKLTVTDNHPTAPLSDTTSTPITASATSMRVSKLTGVGGAANGSGRWNGSVKIQMALSTGGNPGSGIVVSGAVSPSSTATHSCTTDATGACTVTMKNYVGASLTFSVTQVNDTSATYTYDPGQNLATNITFSANSTVVKP